MSTTFNSEALPQDFLKQVKLALKHLYDLHYLLQHPFALQQPEDGLDIPVGSPAQRLRNELLMAIEALSPGPGAAPGTPHARLYQSAHLHYVEGLNIERIAFELGVSTRQMYRDLRRAERGVAAVLWHRFQPDCTSPEEEPRLRSN